jgi:hypothetical protein
MKLMTDFFVFGATYNRPKLLASICKQLSDEAKETGLTVKQYAMNDWSTEKFMADYTKLQTALEGKENYAFEMGLTDKNHGRDEYWKTVNDLFKKARIENFTYGIMIPDDVILCKNFLKRSKQLYDHMRKQEPPICAVNIMNVGPVRWGTNRWLDGSFICEKRFLGKLGFAIYAIQQQIFQANPNSGTRVFEQVSARCGAMGGPVIAPVPPVSLVRPATAKSVMFPESRYPDRVEMFEIPNFVDGGIDAPGN